MKPPAPSLLTPLIKYLTLGMRQHKSLAEVALCELSLPWIITLFMLQGVIAMVLTVVVARRRAISNLGTLAWSGVSVGLGWAVP